MKVFLFHLFVTSKKLFDKFVWERRHTIKQFEVYLRAQSWISVMHARMFK